MIKAPCDPVDVQKLYNGSRFARIGKNKNWGQPSETFQWHMKDLKSIFYELDLGPLKPKANLRILRVLMYILT